MCSLQNTRSESEALAKRVCHYHKNVADLDSKLTWHHFKKEGHPKTTIYRYIKKFKDCENVTFKKNPGRTPRVSTPQSRRKVEKVFKANPSLSISAAAQKLKISRSTLQRIKLKDLGIKARTKKTVPKYVKDQENRAKTACRKICDSLSGKVAVIDDETYVMVDPSETPGKKYYHSRDPDEVDYDQKVKKKSKFPEKFLVWQAMDSFGNISSPYISKGCINQTVYKNECLKKRLIPFINKHHEISDVLFWPDMATSHYAKTVTEWMDSQNLKYVPKKDNAPNVPQCRPIEKFWALCKAKYAKHKNKPKNIEAFKRIWVKVSKEVSETSGAGLMASIRQNLRSVARHGVRSVLGPKN